MDHSYPEVTPKQQLFGKLALLIVIITLIGNVVAFSYLRPYGILRELSPLAEAREHIHNRYVGEVEDQALIDAALKGMADALGDENTQYLSADQLKDFNEQVGGQFTGIGAEIGIHEDRLMIISPLDNSPALKAGLKPGDIVLEVDGQSTLGLEIEEAVGRIKGKAGTTVVLKVRHPDGEVHDVTITRATVSVTTVRGFRRNPGNGYDFMLDPANKIAYLRLTQFGENSAEEVKETLTQLKSQGMAALIFDLRNNGGGLLEGAAQISDLFLTGGQTIVSTKSKGPTAETLVASNNTLLPNLPVVFLINGNSASASEIVAGAMLDNDRALLVGSRTFGKGSVQQLLPLSGGSSAIKLTTAYWYMPSGNLIHRKAEAERWGVDPSPGCYVPIDGEQLRAMLIKRRDSELDDAYGKLQGPVTPQWLRDEMLDAPLAAGLDAAQRMLSGERRPKVGIDQKTAPAPLNEREALEQRKQELLDLIQKIDSEIEALPADEEGQP